MPARRVRPKLTAIACAALLAAAAPPAARADDPDMASLQTALDEASASLDTAWLGTLVEHAQYDAALAALDAALASAARLKGDDQAAATARAHAWAARAHLAKGDLARAGEGYRRALAAMGPSPRARRELEVDARVGLAWIALAEGDHATSIRLFLDVGALLERQGRAETPSAVPHLLGIARAHLAAKDLAKAREAIVKAREAGGHAPLAEVLRVQALIDLARGDAARARDVARRVIELEDGGRLLREIATTPFERHNLTMMDRLNGDLAAALTIAERLGGRDADATRLALTTLLRRKGLVLDITAARSAAVRKQAAKTPALAERLRQLAAIESELAALELRAPSPSEREARAKRMAELIDGADMRLAAMDLYLPPGAGSADAIKQATAVDIEAVRRALPEDGALIELIRYTPMNEAAASERERRGAPRYAAFVLRRAGEPAMVALGDAGVIDGLAADLRRALVEQRADTSAPARALHARVVAPLKPALGGARRLFIAPDGALHTVPFEAMVDESGRSLIEAAGITYLGTGRELARARASSKPEGAPVILANPTYNKAGKGSQPSATRGVDMRKVRFTPLPGTASEAQGIRKAFPDARLFLGEDATRDALLSIARPPILHIATHGFFLSGDAGKGGGRGLELDPSAAPSSDPAPDPAVSPLARSGLALAGADGGGGVLSALELASLDLTGTKLAVLSACETGLGDVKSGEGVFGLRRALAIAGAETQVVSLWKVDDQATQAMMVDYYARLRAGGGRSEAMRQTRLAMMRRPETAHPYYWASFLVSGDATALDGSDVPMTDASSAPTQTPNAAPPAVTPGARGCGCEAAGAPASPPPTASALIALALAWLASRRASLLRR